MKKLIAFLIILLLTATVSEQDAAADLISFGFEGVLKQVSRDTSDNILESVLSSGSPFGIGSPIKGMYTFDSTAPDLISGDTERASYPLIDYVFQIGNYSGSLIASNEIGVLDTAPGETIFSRDEYRASITGLIGPSVSELDPFGFEIVMRDYSQTAFTSDALPLTPPIITDFDPAFINFVFTDPRNPVPSGTPLPFITGDLTRLELIEGQSSPIPEPATMFLFGSGLFGLLGLKRKKIVV